MNTTQAKLIRIVDYLDSINVKPAKHKNNEYWYLSPLHQETIPSFKVCERENIWYDHGIGKGGTIIDLLMNLYACTVAEALKKLGENSFSFQQQKKSFDSHLRIVEMEIHKLQSLQNPALLKYIAERGIPLHLAARYCQELYYRIDNHIYYSIAFPNDVGGYELRNKYMKNCIGKKGITTINKGTDICKVFEGFFDFLAYWTLQNIECNITCIVLNTLSNTSNAIEALHQYQEIHLYLDNDSAGLSATQELSKHFTNSINQAHHYAEYKDINDYLLLKRKNES